MIPDQDTVGTTSHRHEQPKYPLRHYQHEPVVAAYEVFQLVASAQFGIEAVDQFITYGGNPVAMADTPHRAQEIAARLNGSAKVSR